MNKLTLLAILTVLPYYAMATPDEDQRLLEQALQERAEVIDRDIQRKLDQLLDASEMTLQLRSQDQIVADESERSNHGRPLRLAAIIAH